MVAEGTQKNRAWALPSEEGGCMCPVSPSDVAVQPLPLTAPLHTVCNSHTMVLESLKDTHSLGSQEYFLFVQDLLCEGIS